MSLDAEQFHFEDEGAVRRDSRAGAVRAVGEVRRDDEFKFVADLHELQAFGPTGNDLVQRKGGRLAARDGAVEHGAIEQFALVMHGHGVGGLGRNRAGAMLQDQILQAAGGGGQVGIGDGRSGGGGGRSICAGTGDGLRRLATAQQAQGGNGQHKDLRNMFHGRLKLVWVPGSFGQAPSRVKPQLVLND